MTRLEMNLVTTFVWYSGKRFPIRMNHFFLENVPPNNKEQDKTHSHKLLALITDGNSTSSND